MTNINRVEISERFAEMWRTSRADAGKSQDYMAKALGVSKATIQNWEAGTSCPSQEKGFEWFLVLGLQPVPYYMTLLYPNICTITEESSDEEIDRALMNIVKCQTMENKRKLFFLLSGEHGSSPTAVMEMITAHLQSPLRERINVAQSIETNYNLAKISGTLVCPQCVQPNMKLLKHAIMAGLKSVINGKTEYSAIFGQDEVNL